MQMKKVSQDARDGIYTEANESNDVTNVWYNLTKESGGGKEVI
jgi:hypothetical protein